jgi:prophage antirepressor-like protein
MLLFKAKDIRTETWCGHNIRFVNANGEWWAILKDICDALDLHTFKVSQRLPANMLERVQIDVSDIPSEYNGSSRKPGENKTRWMLVVNELGVYEALFASRKLEARKFRLWAGTVMQKLRSHVGLEGYEVMRMTEPEIQEKIDHLIDTIYWDEETGKLMQSITVQGGDVEQVEFK